MSKAKLLLVLAFAVVCAAGGVVGTAIDRQVHSLSPPPPPPPAHHGPFDLDLSPEQSKAMKEIWGRFDETRHQLFTQRRQYDHDRRSAYEALLTPEQLEQYKKIQSEYETKVKDLDEQTHKAAELAIADSNKILTPHQQKLFTQARDHMHGPGGPGIGGPPGIGGGPNMGGLRNRFDRGDHHRTTSAPTTQPQAQTP